MKKISLYILSLLALGFTACTEDFNVGVANPQSWEQDPAAAGMTFTTASVAAIDLATVTTDSVAVLSFSTPTMAADATVTKYEVALDGKITLGMSSAGKVKVSELQSAVVELYGKKPAPRTMSGVGNAIVSLNGQAFRVKAAAANIVVTPVAPVIESEYYLIGDITGWDGVDVSKLIKFDHSDADVYDDPFFTLIVEVPANCSWKVVPKSTIDKLKAGTISQLWDGQMLGALQDGWTELEGQLTVTNPGAVKIVESGLVKITLNMMEYTYQVKSMAYLYVPGNHQGWNPATAPYVFTSDKVNYKGFMALDGEFKFTSARDWDGTNYGNGGDGKLSTDSGAGNLSLSAGFYYLEANPTDLTWKHELITTFGLIGDATEGGWDASTAMDFDPATLTYTVTATLKAGAYKFRANNDWSVNLGGDLNNLSYGGDNIAVTAGKYKITLYLAEADHLYATAVAQ